MQTLSSEDSASVRSLEDAPADVTSSLQRSSVTQASVEQASPPADQSQGTENESTRDFDTVETTQDVQNASESGSESCETSQPVASESITTASSEDLTANTSITTTNNESETLSQSADSVDVIETETESVAPGNPDDEAGENKEESDGVVGEITKTTENCSEEDEREIEVKVQQNDDAELVTENNCENHVPDGENTDVNTNHNDVTESVKPEATLPPDPVKLRKGGMLDMTSPRMANALKQARRDAATKTSKPTPMKATHRPTSMELALVTAQEEVATSSGQDTGACRHSTEVRARSC